MKNKNPDIITKNRIIIIGIFSLLIFLVLAVRISYLQLYNNKASVIELNKLTTKTVYGSSMPRGRIYDRNLNVIVDNKGTYLIGYKRESGVTTKEEIKIAYYLAEKLELNYSNLKERQIKEFWILNNPDKANEKITDEEYEEYERRKLKSKDLENLKIKRITEEELNSFDEIDKKASYIYYLMNNGYYYDEKII